MIFLDPRQKKSVIKEVKQHNDTINDLKLIDYTVMTGGKDNSCIIWDTRKFDAINILRQHQNSVNIIKSDSYNKKYISGSKDGTCRIWNLDGRVDHVLKITTNKLMITNISIPNIHGIPSTDRITRYDLNTIFVGYNDSTFRYWNLSKPAKVNKFYKEHKGAITSIVSYSNKIYSGSNTGEIKSIFYL